MMALQVWCHQLRLHLLLAILLQPVTAIARCHLNPVPQQIASLVAPTTTACTFTAKLSRLCAAIQLNTHCLLLTSLTDPRALAAASTSSVAEGVATQAVALIQAQLRPCLHALGHVGPI